MTKTFECPLWSHTPLFLWENRHASRANFTDGIGQPAMLTFLLDTGAIISTMTRENAEIHDIYDKNVICEKAVVGGFTGTMKGRVISVDKLWLGKLAVKNTFFFVPDERIEITEVLGANVLNGLVPIPEFYKTDKSEWDSKDRNKPRGRLWFMKNENIPPSHYSSGLGVSVSCEVLLQEDNAN